MRAIVIGTTGAVGQVVAATLRARGHSVGSAGRSPGNDLRVDVTDPTSCASSPTTSGRPTSS